jgi:hypothetical protein
MPEQEVHVVPHANGWRVQVSGRTESSHTTQSDAGAQARYLARLNGSEALLHGRNGRIRERNTYGGDPRRTKG